MRAQDVLVLLFPHCGSWHDQMTLTKTVTKFHKKYTCSLYIFLHLVYVYLENVNLCFDPYVHDTSEFVQINLTRVERPTGAMAPSPPQLLANSNVVYQNVAHSMTGHRQLAECMFSCIDMMQYMHKLNRQIN